MAPPELEESLRQSGKARLASGRQSKLKVATVSPSASESSRAPSVPDSPPDPLLGCTVDDRYRIDSVLGEGGMGIVYRCTHTIIGKKVAMKVLRADMARDEEVTERFLNEAKSASAIGNAHIIDISDFGRLPDGSTYFIMEFLAGTALADVVEDGKPLTVSRILHIAHQLAEGLAAAHHSGIVHRDLKPDNIFLVTKGSQKDFVKILDFGIAKVSSGEGSKLTQAGAVFGTPHYMSPEQAAGAPVDHRSDIYAFGVILYELASGKVPFDADNFMGILTQHMYKAPVPIRALVPEPQEVPPGLEAMVLKCLSKRPEQRYQSMDELSRDIERLKEGGIPEAVPDLMNRSGGFNVPADYFKTAMPAPVPAEPAGVRSRNKWPMYAGIAGVVAAVVLVVGVLTTGTESPASAPTAASIPTPASAIAAANTASSAPEETPPTPDDMTIQVVLAISPIDAHAFEGETDLGTSPVIVQVPHGKSIDLVVKRAGYSDKTVSVDGTKTKLSVNMDPVPSSRPAIRAKPKPKPKPKPRPAGGGEIVNPWN